MKTLLLFITFIPILLQAQENSRVQMGVYAGIGISNYNKKTPGISFEIGQSTIIAAKKKRKLRIEVFFQYTNNSFKGGSRKAYSSGTDSTYSLSHHKIDFFNAGLKWHIPIVYRPKYRLFLTPGFIIGGINKSRYNREWYRFSDNSLVKEGSYDGYVSTRLVFGPTVCIAQEFRLTENLCLNISLNGFVQSTVEFDAMGPWSTCSLHTGLYWYLKSKKTGRKSLDK
jgi:hypothetical protein